MRTQQQENRKIIINVIRSWAPDSTRRRKWKKMSMLRSAQSSVRKLRDGIKTLCKSDSVTNLWRLSIQTRIHLAEHRIIRACVCSRYFACHLKAKEWRSKSHLGAKNSRTDTDYINKRSFFLPVYNTLLAGWLAMKFYLIWEQKKIRIIYTE